MDKFKNKINYKLNKIVAILSIVVIWLPFFDMSYGQVIAVHDYNTGSEVIKTLDAGECIEIPSEIPQSGGSYEPVYQTWSYRQKEINDIWKEQGEKVSDEHWAYIETNSGEKRLLVALSSIYGETGSYVDIYVNNNGEEKVYPCVMADAKSAYDSTTHWWPNAEDSNKVTYGHMRRNSRIFKYCRSIG